MQLDAVAGRVTQERLPPSSNRRSIRDGDSVPAELGYRAVKVGYLQREMLADRCRWVALDEVYLLTSGVEPFTGEPEVRAVFSAYYPQLVDVEARRLVDIADVDRDVVNGD